MRVSPRIRTTSRRPSVLAAEPSEVGKTRTTCVATMLRGGHADNALPQSATATINCRIFPGTSAADVQKTLQQKVGPNVEVSQGYEALVSDASPMRADIMAAVARAIAAADPGARVVPTQAAYATDGAVYRSAGIPTYGVGGVFIKDSEEFAHGLNERIRVDAFYDALDLLGRADQDAGGRALMSDAPGRSSRLPRPARLPRSEDSPPPTHCRCARGRTRAARTNTPPRSPASAARIDAGRADHAGGIGRQIRIDA